MATAKVIDQDGQDVSPNGTAEASEEKPARFVTPAFTTLHISHGDWLRVKERLTYGETVRLRSAGLTDMMVNTGEDGQRVGLDIGAFDLAKVAAWVVEWSFTGERGGRVPVNKDTIEALDPDTATEIIEALDKYTEAQDARKNARSIGTGSART